MILTYFRAKSIKKHTLKLKFWLFDLFELKVFIFGDLLKGFGDFSSLF